MTAPTDIRKLLGARMMSAAGEEIGTIEQIFFDDITGEQEWARLRISGLLGGKDRFVPLAGGRMTGDDMTVPFDRDKVKSSPELVVDRHISPEQEERLRNYYGLSRAAANAGQSNTATNQTTTAAPASAKTTTAAASGITGASGMASRDQTTTPAARTLAQRMAGNAPGGSVPAGGTTMMAPATTGMSPTPSTPSSSGQGGPGSSGMARPMPAGPSPTGAMQQSPMQQASGTGGLGQARHQAPSAAAARRPEDLTMLRSEERIHFRTEEIETGRVRLRKHVDVIPVEERVRLVHEEFELERIPATDGGGGQIGEDAVEISLRGQTAFAVKDVVPIERVRLTIRQVPEERVIRDEIRRERIEVERLDGAGRDAIAQGMSDRSMAAAVGDRITDTREDAKDAIGNAFGKVKGMFDAR